MGFMSQGKFESCPNVNIARSIDLVAVGVHGFYERKPGGQTLFFECLQERARFARSPAVYLDEV